MNKFTPGAWRLEKAKGSRGLWVGGSERGICQMTGKIDAQREANAYLIAAAPDLFKALEDFVGYHKGDYEALPETEKALKALAKAKGEQT